VCRSPAAKSVGIVATPAFTPPEVVSDAVTHRVRASVGLKALDVQAQALGACPQVRVLKPALVGEQRVVHLPERVLMRRRIGRRPPGRATARRRRGRVVPAGVPDGA
jgi:hypothetical protein